LAEAGIQDGAVFALCAEREGGDRRLPMPHSFSQSAFLFTREVLGNDCLEFCGVRPDGRLKDRKFEKFIFGVASP
jgi:hypothetical protein